jgi:hypothetical protein
MYGRIAKASVGGRRSRNTLGTAHFTYLPSRLVSRPRLIGWAFSLNISQGAAVASDSILRLLSQLGKCARLGGNASR